MLKEIDLAGALKRIAEGSNQVCMLVPINADTLISIEDLIAVKGFALVTNPVTNRKEDPADEEEPEKQEKKLKKKAKSAPVDRGKVIALYRAGWNITSICEEVCSSYPTVKKIIDQESGNAGSVQADS